MKSGVTRVFADLERIAGRFPHALWHSPAGARTVVIWCSNDYLGMGQHPKWSAPWSKPRPASAPAPAAPATSPAPIIRWCNSNRNWPTVHGKEASLLFTSGYVSNQTGIPTIAKLIPNCADPVGRAQPQFDDRGIRQSGCERQVFHHSDMAHLEELLRAAGPDRPKLIACESLYSMDGDIAPLARICDLAERYRRV